MISRLGFWAIYNAAMRMGQGKGQGGGGMSIPHLGSGGGGGVRLAKKKILTPPGKGKLCVRRSNLALQVLFSYKGNNGSTWIMSWRPVLLLISMCQKRRISKEWLDRFLLLFAPLY